MSVNLPSVFQATGKIVITRSEKEDFFVIKVTHHPSYSSDVTRTDEMYIHARRYFEEDGEEKFEKLTVVLEDVHDEDGKDVSFKCG